MTRGNVVVDVKAQVLLVFYFFFFLIFFFFFRTWNQKKPHLFILRILCNLTKGYHDNEIPLLPCVFSHNPFLLLCSTSYYDPPYVSSYSTHTVNSITPALT